MIRKENRRLDSFRTEIPVAPFPSLLHPGDGAFVMGSCFSENLVPILRRAGIRFSVNPAGIHYHPTPMSRVLRRIREGRIYLADDLFFDGSDYISPDHHGSFRDHSPETLLDSINQNLLNAKKYIEDSKYAFLTLATSRAFVHRSNRIPWANCHRLPGSAFEERMHSEREIFQSLDEMRNSLRSLQPEIQIIWSASPVRHVREGLVRSSLSKSRIISAIHEVVSTDANSHYFPSYEIMNDDLRDYRFYADDMAHPSPLAIVYIMTMFRNAAFSRKAEDLYRQSEEIETALLHRARNRESPEYGAHLERQRLRIQQIMDTYPDSDFTFLLESWQKRASSCH